MFSDYANGGLRIVDCTLYIRCIAPVCRIAISMNTNYSFTGSHTESPFWYQPSDIRQILIPRGGQPTVELDAADNCCLYVTTIKARIFQDVIPSIPIDNFKDQYVLVFRLPSIQDATETCHFQELVGGPLRLELNFIIPLEYVIDFTVLGERMSLVAA